MRGGRYVRETRWSVGLALATPAQVLELLTGDGRILDDLAIRWVEAQRTGLLADPFLFSIDGALVLAVEDLTVRRGRGILRFLELTEAGEVRGDLTTIEAGQHLAFPGPASFDGATYVIPDMASKEITAVPVGGGLAPIRFLDGGRPVRGSDPFLVRDPRGDLLLASDPTNQLWQWSVDTSAPGLGAFPVGDGRKVEGAGRLAGGIISVEGRSFRLEQGSVGGYGTSVLVYEVSPTAGDLAGARVGHVRIPADMNASLGFDGIHHISYLDGLLAFDVRRRTRPSPLTPFRKAWFRARSGS